MSQLKKAFGNQNVMKGTTCFILFFNHNNLTKNLFEFRLICILANKTKILSNYNIID